VLTQQEARKVIETPDVKTLLGYRDRTILEVLYATGIRKSELMNLTLDDVNLEEELLRVNQGKGRRDRVVPLSGIACSFLENYIKGIRSEFLKASDAQKNTRRLFISLRGRPMSSNGVGDVVEKYGRLSRVKKRVTCHIWRHTCATHLLQNNANLRHVQENAGTSLTGYDRALPAPDDYRPQRSASQIPPTRTAPERAPTRTEDSFEYSKQACRLSTTLENPLEKNGLEIKQSS
jgi:integrase/recombinase XerD